MNLSVVVAQPSPPFLRRGRCRGQPLGWSCRTHRAPTSRPPDRQRTGWWYRPQVGGVGIRKERAQHFGVLRFLRVGCLRPGVVERVIAQVPGMAHTALISDSSTPAERAQSRAKTQSPGSFSTIIAVMSAAGNEPAAFVGIDHVQPQRRVERVVLQYDLEVGVHAHGDLPAVGWSNWSSRIRKPVGSSPATQTEVGHGLLPGRRYSHRRGVAAPADPPASATRVIGGVRLCRSPRGTAGAVAAPGPGRSPPGRPAP